MCAQQIVLQTPGTYIVYVAQAADTPDVPVPAGEWLATVDPNEVQERALNGHDMSGSFAARVLAVLADMAVGQ